ncbi:energy transducer TonB [Mesosutterella sp. OilRF-GAM-744-9]|uniref:Energy transducer TonB n=1 Tax=Mesosutterella porci TaxID=2915351 RepID=A0ABS9MNC0_9BURK|nr:energy transducer TonB [Mesosutterella sp. oilRF-744-WT-GAM-9]MCG5030119.1 energy transducer TonB [Mesosutterella sp. oilRF-744-WT-GAM-9]
MRSSLRYPPRAAENGWQGVALMEFSVSADGRIQSLRVYESSGRAILDRAAQSAVEKAASQWGAPRRPVKIRVPVRFSLKR